MRTLKIIKPEKHILSKSTFMYGCQCIKRLWMHKYMPEERDEIDEEQSAIFQTGTDVGVLAQQRFPGGVDARPIDTFHYQQSVMDTAAFIAKGETIIYEAAFQYNGVMAALDILIKKNGKWYAYEVKSSTSAKDQFVLDAALQYFVITNSGLPIENIFILHLNNKYIRNGALDVQQLFTATSVLGRVLQQQDFIKEKIDALKDVVKNKTIPVVEVGNHCDNPYPCDFQGYCFKGIIQNIPDYGEKIIFKNEIKSFLKELKYPLFFLDFETWMTAVPEHDGHWPFRQVPFQYSLHVQKNKNAEVEHYYYLAEKTDTPLENFIIQLLNELGTDGSIIVYNKTFENTRLNELKEQFKQYEKPITAVQKRMIDLMVPFRRKHYYLPEMQGSYSIKKVLPALIPELSYEKMEIGNGGDASSAFYNLKVETDQSKIIGIRNLLLEYCKLDTWAMVKILKKLNEVI